MLSLQLQLSASGAEGTQCRVPKGLCCPLLAARPGQGAARVPSATAARTAPHRAGSAPAAGNEGSIPR